MFFEKLFDYWDIIHQNRILYFTKKLDLDILIDVGAHTGEFLSFLIKNKKFKSIYVFEPQNEPFKILKRNYIRNTRVKLFNLALSDKICKKNFYIGKLTGTSTLESLNTKSTYLNFKQKLLNTKKNYEKKIILKTNSIDNLFKKKNLSKSLLKIDVEGHELKVLKGSKKKLKQIPYLLVENHFLDLYKNNEKIKKEKFLKKNNFKIVKKFIHPLLIFEDNLYINTKLNN